MLNGENFYFMLLDSIVDRIRIISDDESANIFLICCTAMIWPTLEDMD